MMRDQGLWFRAEAVLHAKQVFPKSELLAEKRELAHAARGVCWRGGEQSGGRGWRASGAAGGEGGGGGGGGGGGWAGRFFCCSPSPYYRV